MKDEIKELLEHIEILDNTDYILHSDKAKALLNYITNLQKENENLKQRLESKNAFIKFVNNKYKQRIDKAIEYIKTCNPDVDLNSMFLNESYISNYGANELLKILGGDE